MDLQFRGHRYLDDVIANLEKRYGKPGKKAPQPSAFNMVRQKQPRPARRRRVALQPAPMSVLDTGALPATVTTRRKRKRATPDKPMLSEKEDRKRRMKKRHWYEDKFGDLSKFVKKPGKRAAAKRAAAKIKRGKRWYAKKFQVEKFVKRQRAPAKSRDKNPICFNRRTTLLSLLKRIPAIKTPLATMFG